MITTKINLGEVSAKLKKLRDEEGASTLLGSMMTTSGVLVLLFSHRHNKEFPVLVTGMDYSKVMTKVSEAMSEAR